MKKAFLAVSVLAFAMAAAAPSRADVVQSKERFFTAKYKDGFTERYKVKWQALRDMSVQEHGGPAKPLEGKFTDDRRCQWHINARIERRLYMVARNGQAFAKESAFRSYNSDFRNEGSSFVLTNLRPGNCNDTAARRGSDWNDARTKLLGAFAGVTEADFANLKKEMKKDAQLLEIVE